MVVEGKKPRHGQLKTKDRLSDLPDSILHHIISFLGTKGACRTSILSKRWVHIWSTGLIIDFRPMFFVAMKDGIFEDEFVGTSTSPYREETVERLMNFIESTMRRYSEKNLSIRVFRLEYPTIDPKMSRRIDKWLGIALQNQVKKLLLSVIPKGFRSYLLPAFFFLAKSLINVTLSRVRVPYFENMKLISLQCLVLTKVDIDEHMLHDIIKSCPLKFLSLDWCSGLQNISIPSCSGLESLSVARTVPVGGTILVDTSSFQHCTYLGYVGGQNDPFPIILTPASKKNLRVLHISHVCIVDDIFGKLVSELPSIETMNFFNCTMPINVNIASQTLKKFDIRDCYELINLMIEAPNLNTFCYRGDLQLSLVINSHNKYNAYLHLICLKLDTGALVAIKNLLGKSNCCCKDLSIFLRGAAPEIEFDEDQLNKIDDGSPCDVKELKLSLAWASRIRDESSHGALIDGLLWCCRPDILSLSVTLITNNAFTRTLLEILEMKVEYWKHPLKRMEIEGAKDSLSSWDFDLRLKLYW